MEGKLVINEHMDMRWHEGKPRIFIDDKPFMHCAYLVVSVDATAANEEATVDDLAERPGARALEGGDAMKEYGLTRNEVLWGFYSSILGWYENGYNTQVIHSNLAFPLLKELARVGDEKAKRVLRGEITDRLRSKNPNTVAVIIETCAQLLDEEDWRIIVSLLKPVMKQYDPAGQPLIGRTIALKLSAEKGERLHLKPGDAYILDALIALGDQYISASLAYAIPRLPKPLADHVSDMLSNPEWDWSVLTYRYVGEYTSSAGALARVVKHLIKRFDAEALVAMTSKVKMAELLVALERGFSNPNVTPEMIEQSLKAFLKKDLGGVTKVEAKHWLSMIIPVIEAALRSRAATKEHVQLLVDSHAFQQWTAEMHVMRDLIRFLSIVPAARGVPLPVFDISEDVQRGLGILFYPNGLIHIYNSYGNMVDSFKTIDDLVEYLKWTGLDLQRLFAGATLRSRVIKAQIAGTLRARIIKDKIPLEGTYTRHFLASNILGLRAFAKEKGLTFTRLLENGRYTSAYSEQGHAYMLNSNYGREEWKPKDDGSWEKVLPREPAADKFILYENDRKLKVFETKQAAEQYLKSIVADDPDTDVDSFKIEKDESSWDPW